MIKSSVGKDVGKGMLIYKGMCFVINTLNNYSLNSPSFPHPR